VETFNHPHWLFFSYRRSEYSHWLVGRLVSQLESIFGSRCAFWAPETIVPGVEWGTVLMQAITKSLICLVVIDKNWNIPKLHRPNDWVHQDILEAINQHTIVIPIVIDDVQMPEQTLWPADIAAVSRIQYKKLDGRSEASFRLSMDQLAQSIQENVYAELVIIREPQGWWDRMESNTWSVYVDGAFCLGMEGVKMECRKLLMAGEHAIRISWSERERDRHFGQATDFGYKSSGDADLRITLMPGISVFSLVMRSDSRPWWKRFLSGMISEDCRSRAIVLKTFMPPNWQHAV
jgi:TIR domain-containing protein